MAGEKLATRADATWVDDVAVERYLDGAKVGRPLTMAERHEVTRALHADFIRKTATRLRISPDEVANALLPVLREDQRDQRAVRPALEPDRSQQQLLHAA